MHVVILKSPKFSQLFKDLEIKIITLMEKIGAIPENVVEAMQKQAQMGASQMNPPMPGGMGGMLPGQTPMDILQLQQNMQMQQMMQQQQKK